MKPYSVVLRFSKVVPLSLKRMIRGTNLYSKFTRALKQESVPTISDVQDALQSLKTVPMDDHLRIELDHLSDTQNFFPLCLIEINDICNLNCPMCRTSLSHRKKGVMDLGLFEQSVQKLWAAGFIIYGLHTVGDPLANKSLAEYLKILRKHRIGLDGICTNGLLLESKLDTLFEYRDVIGRISFSIDAASRDVYESIRRGGKWADLHRGLLKFSLRNEKSPRPFPVSVTTVVSKANFHEIALIPHVFSYLARPIDFTFAFLNSKPPFHPSDNPRDDYFQQQSYLGEPYTRSLPCRLMWTRVSLLKEGGLTPCCTDYDGRMVCDSIGTADLSRWFQNPILESWRKASLEGNFSLLPADCQSCYSVDPRLTDLLNMIMKYTLVRLSLHPVRAQGVLNTVGPMIQERDFDGIMEVMRSLDSVA